MEAPVIDAATITLTPKRQSHESIKTASPVKEIIHMTIPERKSENSALETDSSMYDYKSGSVSENDEPTYRLIDRFPNYKKMKHLGVCSDFRYLAPCA